MEGVHIPASLPSQAPHADHADGLTAYFTGDEAKAIMSLSAGEGLTSTQHASMLGTCITCGRFFLSSFIEGHQQVCGGDGSHGRDVLMKQEL